MTTIARRTSWTTTGAALALLLTACGGGTATTEQTTTATPLAADESPTTTPTPSPEPSPTAGQGGSEPTTGLGAFTAPGTEVLTEGDARGYVVTAVRTGEHDGYDRVVYELTGGTGTPGYRVGYVDQAVEDPSGEVRPVAGDAILQVLVLGTTYPVEGGPQEFDEDLLPADGDIEQVVRPLTFEAITQSFVGVSGGQRPFRVFLLTDPARVVVDVETL